jgi:homoserine dehydrogenase
MAEEIRIGLLGFGNIGVGVARNLFLHNETIQQRLERPLRLARIADLDTTTARDTGGFDYAPILTNDAGAVLEAPDIDIVIELIGGYEPARQFIERALKAGKHVVTANKAVLAKYGAELMAVARERGVALLFEASVGGGIPIIRTFQQGLAANDFNAVYGIVNGTTNYILTQMTQFGTPFDKALKDAQDKGYAEPDPTFDIEGIDTAHKMSVLAWLAFGRPTRVEEAYVEGITRIIPADLRFAQENGYRVKMLGIARRAGDGSLELRAHPTFVPESSLLASVNDVYNAIMVEGSPIGSTLYFGRGAGADATSSAVLSDCMALADSIASGGLARESRLLRRAVDMPMRPMSEIEGAFYLRANDGLHLSRRIIDALEGKDIEVAILHAPAGAPVQLLTSPTREGQLLEALKPMGDKMPFIVRVMQE